MNRDQFGSTQPVLPVLAVSAKWYAFPDHFNWLVSQGFALEYTPDRHQLPLLDKHLSPHIERGVKVRHHGFFPGFEFGDTDAEKAEIAMKLHFKVFDLIEMLGEPVITVHAGLSRDITIDPERAKDNLGRLVLYAESRGITVNLENLKNGITSNPEIVREWADASGSKITLDIGHAVSSEWRIKNGVSVSEIIDLFQDRLNEVHLYEQETVRHLPPENLEILGPVLDRLLSTDCSWWTIELEDRQEILNTRRLVEEYIKSKKTVIFNN